MEFNGNNNNSIVRVFKVMNGEEIIADSYEAGDAWILNTPLGVGIDPNQGRLVFVPYLAYTSATKELVLPKSNLMFEPVIPVDEVLDNYNQYRNPNRVLAPRKPSLIVPN